MFNHARRRGLTLAQTAVLGFAGGTALLGTGLMITEAELVTLIAESRARQAAVAQGLEAYSIDWGIFPYDGYNYSNPGSGTYNYFFLPVEMTTPTAYVASAEMYDPFRVLLIPASEEIHWQWRHMRYTSVESTWGEAWDFLQTSTGPSAYLDAARAEYGNWRLVITGPDAIYGPTGWPGVSNYPANPIPFDPTNGIESVGDLVASEVAPQGYLNLPPLGGSTAVSNGHLWR